MWRGSPYAEFASEEFAAAEVARLVELRARAIEERAAALLELGRPEDVIGELEAEIAVEPFRERLRALLMLALARAGRPVESLRAYDEFRRFLADEVGVVPSPGLQAAQRRHRAATPRRRVGGIAHEGPRHSRPAVGDGHVPLHRRGGFDAPVGRESRRDAATRCRVTTSCCATRSSHTMASS